MNPTVAGFGVRPFADVADRWDASVGQSSESWLFHLSDWIALEERSAKSVSFALELDGAIVGLCPLYVGTKQYGRVIKSRFLHTGRARSGPAVLDGLSAVRQAEARAALFAEIDRIAGECGVDSIEVRLPSIAAAYLPPARPSLNPMRVIGGYGPVGYGAHTSGGLRDQVLSLAGGEERLWSGLEHDCRKAVRKATKCGVEVVEAVDRSDIAKYHRLHVDNFHHTGATPVPLAEFEMMWDRLHGRGLMRMYFARHEGRTIAGLIALSFAGASTYWAGSSIREAQNLRPNNLLMWHAILQSEKSGCRWFELGPTFDDADPSSKARRIGRFKEQFGGQPFELFEGVKRTRPLKVAAMELVAKSARAAAAVGRKIRKGTAP